MELNRDKLDYLICIAAARCYDEYAEELDAVDTSSVIFSRSYQNKKRRIIRQYKNRDRNAKLKKFAVRVAICAMLIMSIAFVTVMAIEPLRDAVFETIIEWYDDYFTIRFETPTGAPTNGAEQGKTETPTEAVVTPPDSIEDVRKPTYLPDGVEEEPVIQTNAMVVSEYYLGDNLYCSLTQKIFDSDEKYIDNKDAILEEIIVKGHKAILTTYENKEDIYLVWADDEYVYMLFTYCAQKDELIKIAESI